MKATTRSCASRSIVSAACLACYLLVASYAQAQTSPASTSPSSSTPNNNQPSKPVVALPEASPPYYRVRYEPSTEEGGLIYGVSYTVWIPPGVKELRGVIVHQHGCGEGACRAGQTAAFDWQWQSLAQAHDCALLGPSYEQPDKADCQMWCDPRNGSGATFLKGLDELAHLSGHPELARVPWALWGHSGGGTWAGSMLLLYPQRCAAVWLRSGVPRVAPKEGFKLPHLDIPQAATEVPVMCNLGTQEGYSVKDGRFSSVWPNNEAFMKTLRSQGCLIGLSIDPLSSHECGNQRYLAIPWFDECLRLRLPKEANAPMQTIPFEAGWLHALEGTQTQPVSEFQGDKSVAGWLPNESTAVRWEQYSKDTQVADTTPPPAPINVRIENNILLWQPMADLESGIAQFILLKDGEEFARLPEKPIKTFGRENYQRNSYSDTPSQPMTQPQFALPVSDSASKAKYQVVQVNTLGVSSSPSTEAIAIEK